MEGKCKVCGCTETTPCIGKDGLPCSWILPDLCTACANIYDGYIVETVCAFCDHLKEVKHRVECRTEEPAPLYTCSEKHSDTWIALYDKKPATALSWSGIWNGNLTVRTACIRCPDWQIFPQFKKVKRSGRLVSK
jgi:hypothetical protein